jgi:hypothetical protein
MFKTTEKAVSTPFSDFIRNAKSGEKKKVYTQVLKGATDRQNKQIETAKASAC